MRGELRFLPNRPKTFARNPPLNPTIPHKATNVSICDKRSEPRTGGCGGSDPMSEPVSRARGDTLDARYIECARPTGGSHGLTIDDATQRFKGAKRRAAPGRGRNGKLLAPCLELRPRHEVAVV